jgi:hypothetical protein
LYLNNARIVLELGVMAMNGGTGNRRAHHVRGRGRVVQSTSAAVAARWEGGAADLSGVLVARAVRATKDRVAVRLMRGRSGRMARRAQ